MANNILLKRSAVAGKIPTTSDIPLGSLALNTYDGKLFTKTSQSGTEAVIEIGATPTSTAGLFIQTTQVVSSDVTLTGNNGLSILSVEVADGYTVTISENCTWMVIG